RRLNRHCTHALEAAAGVCMSRGHYEVTVEHLLAQLVQDGNADIHLILFHYNIDRGRVDAALQRHLEVQRSGNAGRPVFSPLLMTWINDAWTVGSVEQQATAVRSGALFTALLLTPSSYTSSGYVDLLEEIPRDEVRKKLPTICAGSSEEEERAVGSVGEKAPKAQGSHSRGTDTALGKFTLDFTAQAKAGELDPVIGREVEIRQCIDILARRRKNNPIIVGEAGVGKTALVEGIAQRVVAKEVPIQLQNVDILSLDLGLLQAGAGVKGEFENRLKSVIEEVQGSAKPIVLFIDEAHTLIGAGGPQGGGDAANLLKPALARGDLRTLAATTWSEYKKYFEKDPALSRRFQVVKCDEPDEETAVAMMRGLAPHYEEDHKVRITDEAVVATVELSNRYISGRQLPDKSVDLLDTCAARVSIAKEAKPPALQDLERKIQILGREHTALLRERDEGEEGHERRIQGLEAELEACEQESVVLLTEWEDQRKLVRRIEGLRTVVRGEVAPDAAATEPEEAPGEDGEKASGDDVEGEEPQGEGAVNETLPSDPDEARDQLDVAQDKLAALQKEKLLVPVDVTSDLVAAVVSDWTGIPAGKMVKDEAETLMALDDKLRERIKGQDSALRAIAESIRSSKLGLGQPETPIGVFMLVGPSGVGKTETGLALADLLFGGERFVVTINMSEFQEKHTVSRLIGSPPGYVGYGEGGVLTEGVRQRPYTVVLLDEVEKADPEVMNLFYQVFDKGRLSDGEGRVIDFRNTVVLMTSNLGSEMRTQMCMTVPPPKKKTVVDALRPVLSKHFKPALFARMTMVPYYPLSGDAMRQIVDLKMAGLVKRVRDTHAIDLQVTDDVANQIVERCSEVETGARNIDHIVTKTILPLLS
ncbi:MAG: type VI secretion system ATPase TssH, partial [Deltaproteobacteria bacterium]|nr:type VI secretion system ATPase TssH [Deltaproteobacteria bacterium]